MAGADLVPFDRRRRQRHDPLLRDLVGDLLRRERLAQGRTLSDVADAAGVSKPYLSEVERGRKEPSSEVLGAICRSLGLGLVDLVGRAHDELTVAAPPTATVPPATVPPATVPPATVPPGPGRGSDPLLMAA